MGLQDIKACKLYKVSNRKQAILNSYRVSNSSALKIQDPADVTTPNKELDEGVVKENKKSESNDTSIAKQVDNISAPSGSDDSHKLDIDLDPAENNVSDPEFKDPADLSNDSKESASEADVMDNNDTDASEVEESTEVVDQSIEAASGTSLPRTDVTDNMNLEVKDIKGILNAQDETSGVSRVSYKNDTEVWVHYNDNVNLNDVMIPAIELMNQSGYTYMEFNRLARSENAIVFVIIKNDTDRTKKSEAEIQQTKE